MFIYVCAASENLNINKKKRMNLTDNSKHAAKYVMIGGTTKATMPLVLN